MGRFVKLPAALSRAFILQHLPVPRSGIPQPLSRPPATGGALSRTPAVKRRTGKCTDHSSIERGEESTLRVMSWLGPQSPDLFSANNFLSPAIIINGSDSGVWGIPRWMGWWSPLFSARLARERRAKKQRGIVASKRRENSPLPGSEFDTGKHRRTWATRARVLCLCYAFGAFWHKILCKPLIVKGGG